MRFNDFRSIEAKFDSTATDCGKREIQGHKIRKGDIIGYARSGRTSHTHCAECWQRWTAENQEADMIESGAPCPW